MRPQTPKPARWDREGEGVREPAGMHWPTAGARHGLGQAGGSLTWRTEGGSPQGSLSTHTCRDEHGGDGERGEQPARKAEAWRPRPTCWNCQQMEVWREQQASICSDAKRAVRPSLLRPPPWWGQALPLLSWSKIWGMYIGLPSWFSW